MKLITIQIGEKLIEDAINSVAELGGYKEMIGDKPNQVTKEEFGKSILHDQLVNWFVSYISGVAAHVVKRKFVAESKAELIITIE